MYMYIYIYMYVCMYIYIYIYPPQAAIVGYSNIYINITYNDIYFINNILIYIYIYTIHNNM